ncbi:TPA: PIN domain-containing protein [Elizabethkingia anophelis]
MELQARNLIIDTQYFIKSLLDFNSIPLEKLQRLIEKGSVKLYLTDITIAEVSKKIEELLPSAFTRINAGDGVFLKAIPAFRKLIEDYDNQKLIGEVRENFNQFLKEYQVNIIPSEKVKVLDIYKMYAGNRFPFSEKKKQEFPDAFALESIRIWCDKEKKAAYILSQDNDWISYVNIHSNNTKHPSLIHLADLAPFINSIIRTDNELENQVEFADKELDRNWDSIKKAILKKVNLFEFASNGLDEEEIDNTFLLDCRLLDKDILEAQEDTATYELSLEIDAIIEFIVPNYEKATWDDEDQRYYNLNYSHIYSKETFNIYMTIDISFEGGLERNFEIGTMEFPEQFIYVPYHDEIEFIDINEWSQNLPVIICGVDENGVITKDGSGSKEFENFQKAKEVFPELEIDNTSENFTNALGNKITENLRFETWEALTFYAS